MAPPSTLDETKNGRSGNASGAACLLEGGSTTVVSRDLSLTTFSAVADARRARSHGGTTLSASIPTWGGGLPEARYSCSKQHAKRRTCIDLDGRRGIARRSEEEGGRRSWDLSRTGTQVSCRRQPLQAWQGGGGGVWSVVVPRRFA